MPDSIRQRLKTNLATALGGEWGLPAPTDERDLPFTSLDNGSETASAAFDSMFCEITLTVARAAVATSPTASVLNAEAEALQAAIHIELCGASVDQTFGDLADEVTYLGGGTAVEMGKFIWGLAEFSVKYHHVRGDPYTIE